MKRLDCAALLLAAASVFSTSAPAAPAAPARRAPPAQYENWGVCPFECCTYRDWTATDNIPVYQDRKAGSALAFSLRRDEKATALTGVVVTQKAARIRIASAMQDGYLDGKDGPQLSLKPGDIVYLLAPLGEGAFLFWYQGKVYRSSLELGSLPTINAEQARMVWWKQIRNSAGKSGWTRSDKFANADACG
ncbi:hypothetical protein GTP23_01740 [Pseudoduganella sp. FT93W]|uniref:Uncharacterized protein n=1 Tax=Duganella fentianensis TaxID=2692177 RepID=A0A845HS87_9BURK|nr:hydrogenase expression/formation protein [Duganella fentianensis]MYN43789.1 hypothetical protein [Duganella fentianensis]